ncbi:hypothetical protein P1P68_06475 [Streptomyces scabiei]|uniref:hypothetical protein n=1 Tax=Streptomyces scabiei TaxID=1930 RepID=UPI00299005C4|nr:hypothetical protein [Streptomyces scabiei]MDW8804445.1 hypothetical protein [Streptomyces scabiei]
MSLYGRIFLSDAAVLMVAVLLLLGPVTVSTPVLFGEALVLLAGLVVIAPVRDGGDTGGGSTPGGASAQRAAPPHGPDHPGETAR